MSLILKLAISLDFMLDLLKAVFEQMSSKLFMCRCLNERELGLKLVSRYRSTLLASTRETLGSINLGLLVLLLLTILAKELKVSLLMNFLNFYVSK